MPLDPPCHLGPQGSSYMAFDMMCFSVMIENRAARAVQNSIENPVNYIANSSPGSINLYHILLCRSFPQDNSFNLKWVSRGKSEFKERKDDSNITNLPLLLFLSSILPLTTRSNSLK